MPPLAAAPCGWTTPTSAARCLAASATSWPRSPPTLADLRQLSECTRQIVKRIASMSVWCESMECRMADGEDIDIDRFQRTSNSLSAGSASPSACSRRRGRHADLDSYLRTKYSRDEVEAEA